MDNITPMVRELDTKLREVESGELGDSEKYNVMESICRTLRAHLRTQYGLATKNNLLKCLERQEE